MDVPQTAIISNSKYPHPKNSLLQQSLSHLPNPLPQPTEILQSNLNYIPHYLMNDDLYKQIHTLNRALIFDQFQTLADLVLEVWHQFANNRSKVGVEQYEQFLRQLCKDISHSQQNGNYYASMLINNKEMLLKSLNSQQLIKSILHNLACSNIQFYGLSKNVQCFPQKYSSTIELKLNMVSEPVKNNYFEELIMNPINQSENYANKDNLNMKTQEQVQADANADLLGDLLSIRRNGDFALQKKKSLRKRDSLVNFFPFVVSRGKKSSQQKQPSPQPTVCQPQQLLNKLLAFCSSPKAQIQKSIQIQDNVIDTYSQMTYYESHMMMHMTNLIFFNGDKFDARLIKSQPYWHLFLKQIEEKIQQIKSEDMVLNQNTRQYGVKSWPVSNLSNQAQKGKQKTQSKNKSIRQKLMSKAKDKLTQLYTTVKQQLKMEPSRPLSPSLSPSMNSPSSLVSSQNKNTVIELQNMKNYILKIMDLQTHKHSSSNRIMDNLRNFADEIKNKIFQDRTPYYFDVQAWMAILIILFKELTLNPAMSYHYTPYKRRVFIGICKKMFKWQSKINTGTDQNTKQSPQLNQKQQIQFKNWPIMLKYLQNNRQQVLSSPPVTQKQTEMIIEEISSLITEKRLLGSTFGNLFDGIEQVKQNLPSIKLVCLSNGGANKNKTISQQCKVVHILISGFLSEDTDKFDQWADMIETMPDSEIYALVWESSTIINLVKFFLKSAVDIIGAIKMMDQLKKKYTDNPFNPAFEVAQLTGRVLAQLVIRTFPNRFINICGYSLGSQVIKQFLHRMISKRCQNLLNNIYIMGGVSDNQQISKILQTSSCPLSLYNCYTNNDLVLKHLLSRCKPAIKPVGLFEVQQVEGHRVVNVDCTKFISGHLKFRSNMRVMGEILEMSIG